MLNLDEKPLRQPLEDNLTLTTAASEEDIERVAAFNASIHAPNVGTLIQNLFLHHPATRGRDLFFVVDEGSGEIVSSLCLIPHFYRQFGYEYTLSLEATLRLELRHVSGSPEPAFTFRRATLDDIPTLRQLYGEAARDLTIHTVRGEGTWRYLETHADGTVTERERWIIQDPDGKLARYVSVQRHPFGEELTVDETARLSLEAALAALQLARKLAFDRENPGIRLNLPASATLTHLARSLEAHDEGTYAWQIHVLDVAALLRALGPVLERRIADSTFASLTREIQLNLYRERIVLHFEAGRLTHVARAVPPRETPSSAVHRPSSSPSRLGTAPGEISTRPTPTSSSRRSGVC